MSKNVNNCNENENLEKNLNELNINNNESNHSINDQNSDYESCEEYTEELVDSKDKQFNENEIQTDEELDQQSDCDLTEEEVNKRRLEAIDLKIEGNKRFKEELYEESIEFYTKALRLCPKQLAEDRAVMFANRSAAKRHLNLFEKAIEDCNKAIELKSNYVKALLRRAQLYREFNDKLDESLADYKRVLELDPNCSEAIVASNELQLQINDRNEKLKKEMMSKLKDLGNLVLRPFGLSTDNFKLSQNAETGGYSVNFQNN
jgi:tetratricopeptide (TPR) repeat protein